MVIKLAGQLVDSTEFMSPATPNELTYDCSVQLMFVKDIKIDYQIKSRYDKNIQTWHTHFGEICYNLAKK